ncbi:hypothetical protein [Mesorhizobium sp. M1406]|uniref:hypothetical protein n=1 Tax=Mesorhizobium sp. M1406 TaxID=2957099 RepID=UPI00333565E8
MYSAFDAVDSVDRWCPPLTLEGGEVLNLTDFQVIDEPAFNKLSDEARPAQIRRARPALLPPRLDQQLDLAGASGIAAGGGAAGGPISRWPA